MLGNIARAADGVIDELHESPEKVEAFLYKRFGPPPQPKQPGFFARLFGAKQIIPSDRPEPTETLIDSDNFDVDRSWHILHYLFTGTAWEGDFPAGFLVSAGKPIGDVDVGYGPARSFHAAEVPNIFEFLNGLTEALLRERLSTASKPENELYGNYGEGWDVEVGFDAEYSALKDHIENLKSFISESMEKKLGLVAYIN